MRMKKRAGFVRVVALRQSLACVAAEPGRYHQHAHSLIAPQAYKYNGDTCHMCVHTSTNVARATLSYKPRSAWLYQLPVVSRALVRRSRCSSSWLHLRLRRILRLHCHERCAAGRLCQLLQPRRQLVQLACMRSGTGQRSRRA